MRELGYLGRQQEKREVSGIFKVVTCVFFAR